MCIELFSHIVVGFMCLGPLIWSAFVFAHLVSALSRSTWSAYVTAFALSSVLLGSRTVALIASLRMSPMLPSV